MKLGAFDFILKPFDVEAVESVDAKRAASSDVSHGESLSPRALRPAGGPREHRSAASPAMQQIFELIRRVAPTKSAVLITGETGTGKELVARAIHSRARARRALFVPLNCAAIPAELLESELFGHARGAFTGAQAARTGKFELADGGTLFLDEIGDMPLRCKPSSCACCRKAWSSRVGSNQRMHGRRAHHLVDQSRPRGAHAGRDASARTSTTG